MFIIQRERERETEREDRDLIDIGVHKMIDLLERISKKNLTKLYLKYHQMYQQNLLHHHLLFH